MVRKGKRYKDTVKEIFMMERDNSTFIRQKADVEGKTYSRVINELVSQMRQTSSTAQ